MGVLQCSKRIGLRFEFGLLGSVGRVMGVLQCSKRIGLRFEGVHTGLRSVTGKIPDEPGDHADKAKRIGDLARSLRTSSAGAALAAGDTDRASLDEAIVDNHDSPTTTASPAAAAPAAGSTPGEQGSGNSDAGRPDKDPAAAASASPA